MLHTRPGVVVVLLQVVALDSVTCYKTWESQTFVFLKNWQKADGHIFKKSFSVPKKRPFD